MASGTKAKNTKKAQPNRTKKGVSDAKNPKFFEIISIAAITVAILLMIGLYFESGMIGKAVSHTMRGLMGPMAYLFPIYLFALFLHAAIKKDYQKYKWKYFMSFCLFLSVMGFLHSWVEGYDYKSNYLAEMGKYDGGSAEDYVSNFLPVYWKRYYDFALNDFWGSGVIGEAIARPIALMFGKLGCGVFYFAMCTILSICVFDVSFFGFIEKFTGKRKNKKNQHIVPEYNETPAPKKPFKEINVFDDEPGDAKNQKNTKKPSENAANNAVQPYEDENFPEPEIRVYNKGQEGFADALGKDNSHPLDVKENHAESENGDSDGEESGSFHDEEIVNELKDASENQILEYSFPSIDILTPPKPNENNGKIEEELMKNSHKLIETLKSFGVRANVTGVSMGPTVTRYEIAPEPGVKVSKIVNLSKDIALSLAAKSVRIEAPIPGKSAVGIELANKIVNTVTLREVLETEEFKNSPSKLSVALGKDICGSPIILDIAKMPHLLIAGATGAGKSVCINTIIMSILYKADPNEVKLVMIDPKVVELGVYNGTPHLLIPVVTDPKKAAGALNWAVSEMTERYEKFAENNVRDIKGYNELMMMNETPELKMPQIVIIIDELADLMMVAPSDVETYICRLAQMARAAGMHLVIATQRPSVNVITGTIKANIPSRISFMVSNQIDSRTILDMAGAEKLIGRGDMLYMPVGASSPVRLQCSFVTDKEVESVVSAVSSNCAPQYKEDVMERLAAEEVYKPEGDDPGDNDELLPSAIELAIDSGSISTSLLQRRFRIGYNRAGSIIDQMEARGIISGLDGNKPRQVLITRDEYNEMIAGGRG